MSKPVVVVTGAASGIGHVTAVMLANRGYHVACFDLNISCADSDPVLSAAEGHLWVAADVGDESQIVAGFQQVSAKYGRLDGLVAAAGILDQASFDDVQVDVFRKVLDINVVGVYLCIREAAKLMKSGASIVVVSSIAGIRGGGAMGIPVYAASKGAATALAKSAARTLAPKGIRVNTLAPGLTESPMTSAIVHGEQFPHLQALIPFGRMGQPEEIAGAIAFLLGPDSTYMAGSTVVVDGGVTMY